MAFYAAMQVLTDIILGPEKAIAAFEKVNGLHLVVHDLTRRLWPYLSPERFRHCSAPCLAVKTTHDWACHDFEIKRLREEIRDYPDGRYHVCHAGLLEWVVPVYLDGQLAWILFAGQRHPSGAFQSLLRDLRVTTTTGHARKPPAGVTEEHAVHVLESLRQLRSRLLQWWEQAGGAFRAEAGARLARDGGLVHRRTQIERYIHDKYADGASVAGLAQALRLSESRAIHLVREIFGRSFIKLVTEMRLRTATSLLRETSMPILDVCLTSGFQDLSHFHRFFRKRFGATPLRYRRMPPA
jgi:AraC-like DNA-binding protein